MTREFLNTQEAFNAGYAAGKSDAEEGDFADRLTNVDIRQMSREEINAKWPDVKQALENPEEGFAERENYDDE